jgi:hypothetical protein
MYNWAWVSLPHSTPDGYMLEPLPKIVKFSRTVPTYGELDGLTKCRPKRPGLVAGTITTTQEPEVLQEWREPSDF